MKEFWYAIRAGWKLQVSQNTWSKQQNNVHDSGWISESRYLETTPRTKMLGRIHVWGQNISNPSPRGAHIANYNLYDHDVLFNKRVCILYTYTCIHTCMRATKTVSNATIVQNDCFLWQKQLLRIVITSYKKQYDPYRVMVCVVKPY